METKEYIVSLKRGVNYNEFWAEMENSTNNLPFVPDREVAIKNERLLSVKSCHYLLTDDEAKKLRNDPRVMGVEIPPNQRKDIELVPTKVQDGNFDKVLVSDGNYQNWGLKRSISEKNNFGTEPLAEGGYEYVLDGSGVDVVILDSGVEAFHPEFRDENGQPRVNFIDWYDAAGVTTTSTIDLSTSSNSSVNTNSYINFEYLAQSYIGYENTLIGSSLVLGPRRFLEGIYNDGALNNLYVNTEDSSRSYRVRFEGWIDFENTDGPADCVWEVRFFDDNKIQILMVRHDDPLSSFFYINSKQTGTDLGFALKDLNLIGGISQRSIALETNDNGNTWTVYGNSTTNYRVVDDLGSWVIEEGLASELGSSGMTSVYSGNDDEGNYTFNTPFPFYAGTTSDSLQPPLHNIDTDGHGTHVAGIAAGNTFGWAKKSNIYFLKLLGLEGDNGDEDSGIDVTDAFDLIKQWHTLKPVDPETGVKRPTVVNMSFGYRSEYQGITGGTYRGTPWVDSTTHPEYGMLPIYHGVRVASVDSDIQEMIDAGIHVCIAAGNYSHKVDVPLGTDYNNFYTSSLYPGDDIYYHRGSSPYDDQAFIVGSIDSDVFSYDLDQKSTFSECGPGVDLYAPGSNIVSACSILNNFDGQTAFYFPTIDDPQNFLFPQLNTSGTSMASPQVAGVVALILQLRPELTPDAMKAFIMANTKNPLYSTGLDNDYQNLRSISDGVPRILFNKFGVNYSFRLKF